MDLRLGLNEPQVRERAYFIWEREGRVFGRADAHWLQAESELSCPVVTVEAVAADAVLVPSPAKVLKPRAKAPAKVALAPVTRAEIEPAAKTAAPPRAKPAAPKAQIAKAKARAPRASTGIALH